MSSWIILPSTMAKEKAIPFICDHAIPEQNFTCNTATNIISILLEVFLLCSLSLLHCLSGSLCTVENNSPMKRLHFRCNAEFLLWM